MYSACSVGTRLMCIGGGTKCGVCDESCVKCSAGTSNDCKTCVSGQYLHASDDHCDSTCSSAASLYLLESDTKCGV